MYTGGFTHELRDLIRRYEERFDTVLGTMVLPPDLSRDDLGARLDRALADDEPIDILEEYYDEEFAEALRQGDILI